MPFAIHDPDGQMYLINDPVRNGLLTWIHDDQTYLMAFTESEKAEQYNAVVLEPRPGEIVIVRQSHARELARKMVAAGVNWMIINYPVINDQDFWDDHPYLIGEVPREEGRNYALVDLRGIVARV